MDLVCWQWENSPFGKNDEIFSFLKYSIMSSTSPNKRQICFNTVCPDQFTVLTFDKSYKNRIPLRTFSHRSEKKHRPRLWYEITLAQSQRDNEQNARVFESGLWWNVFNFFLLSMPMFFLIFNVCKFDFSR